MSVCETEKLDSFQDHYSTAQQEILANNIEIYHHYGSVQGRSHLIDE